MPNFIDVIVAIESTAKKMSFQWGGYFAPNELVNEAWIKSLKSNLFAPALIVRRAKFDMIEYIREQMGREYAYVDGKKVKRVKKRGIEIFKQKHYTGFHSREDGTFTHYDSIFDKPVIDKNLLKLENKELIDLLLSTTTTRNAIAMVHYYLEDHNMKSAAAMMGITEGTMSFVLKKGRKRCKEVVDILELSFAKI